MTKDMNTAYRWIVWGVFCSTFHFVFNGLQIFPAWVGYAMAAYGICHLGAGWSEEQPRFLKPLLVLLVLSSAAGRVLSWTGGVGQSLPGVFSLVVPVLEFASYCCCLDMMKKAEIRVGAYRTAYLLVEVSGMAAGLAGTMFLIPAALYFFAFAMIAGKVIFFFCIWGESRKAGN